MYTHCVDSRESPERWSRCADDCHHTSDRHDRGHSSSMGSAIESVVGIYTELDTMWRSPIMILQVDQVDPRRSPMLPDFIRSFISREYPLLKIKSPNALDLGMDYVEYMLERSDNAAVLRFGIAVSMLDRREILLRHYDASHLGLSRGLGGGELEANASQELQGYVDTTLLLLATYVAFTVLRGAEYNKDIHETSIYEKLQRSSQFQGLPAQIRNTAWQFTRTSLAYVIDEFRLQSQDNIAGLLDIIDRRTESNNQNMFYIRGVWTACNTYSLYLELLTRVLSR